MRRVSPIMFLDDIEELRRIESESCAHAEWRWLDCDECRETIGACGEKVCVACGADVE